MDSLTPALSAGFIDLLMDAVFAVDVNANVVYASASCERIFGYLPAEMMGKSMFDMILPADRERTRQSIVDVMAGCPQFHFENRYVRKDGQIVHIMWSARWSPADQLRIGVARDVTDRKQAEIKQSVPYAIADAAFAALDLYTLFRRIHDIVGGLVSAENFSVMLFDEGTGKPSFPYHVDAHEPTPDFSRSATGLLCAQTMDSGQPLLLAPQEMQVRMRELQVAAQVMPSSWLSVPLKSHNGIIGVLALKSYPGGVSFSGNDQDLLQFASTQIATAIERQQFQGRLWYLANYDALTDLPNRRAFLDRFKAALARAESENSSLSVLYLDLDRFKQVNDTHGHGTGDGLLQQVASRLAQCVNEPDVVARMGGDEFVVLLHAPQAGQTSACANRLCDVLAQPFLVEGHLLAIVPSVGIASYPEHGQTEDDLLKYADRAMYEVKRRFLDGDSASSNAT